MKSKERVLTAFHHQTPDRVPINYLTNPGIDRRLKHHLNLAEDDDEGLLQFLGVDFRVFNAAYIGPNLYPQPEGYQANMWGSPRRWVDHETGGYWESVGFPLKDATLEQVNAWPMPSPDNFDYRSVAESCKRCPDYAIVIGATNFGDIINSTSLLRTMEQTLVDLISDDPVCMRWIDRRLDVQLEILGRTLEATRGMADIFWMGEDLGTQRGPLISPRLFRKHLRPRLQKFVDLAKGYGLLVMVHSCGSSSWAFPDFIEMGVDVVDTLQPEAAGMEPALLKEKFGDQLAFHGAISTAGPVAFGTVEETILQARQVLEVMMPGGGYAFAPCHQLQDNSRVENIVALYQTANECGKYASPHS